MRIVNLDDLKLVLAEVGVDLDGALKEASNKLQLEVDSSLAIGDEAKKRFDEEKAKYENILRSAAERYNAEQDAYKLKINSVLDTVNLVKARKNRINRYIK